MCLLIESTVLKIKLYDCGLSLSCGRRAPAVQQRRYTAQQMTKALLVVLGDYQLRTAAPAEKPSRAGSQQRHGRASLAASKIELLGAQFCEAESDNVLLHDDNQLRFHTKGAAANISAAPCVRTIDGPSMGMGQLSNCHVHVSGTAAHLTHGEDKEALAPLAVQGMLERQGRRVEQKSLILASCRPVCCQ